MKRWIGTAAAAVLTVAMAGCNGVQSAGGNTGAGALKQLGKDEKATIKVMYYDKNSFFQQYGNLFISKFPNIDIEVVSNQGIYGEGKDPEKEMEKLIEEEKPDVLFIQNLETLEKYVEKGHLYALDDVIKQDKFDIENLLPATIETIKSKGQGKLYGLSPDFYGQALFYNKDLFEQNGVPLPKNQMSWEEVFELAKRFPTDGQGDQRIYGIAPYSYMSTEDMGFQLMSGIGMTQGLSYIDAENMKVTLQSDAWKKALEIAVDAIKSGAIYTRKEENNNGAARMYEDYLLQNPFVAGKAAMTIEGNYLIDNMQQAKERLKDKFKPFNWEVVTVPVDPQNREYSNSVSVSQLFGINAQSANTRAAWEFVKYVNSEDYARVVSKSSQSMLTRTKYIKEKDGHNMEAFYLLKPNPDSPFKNYEKIPNGFYQPFSMVANQEIKAVTEGKKTAGEALQTIQQTGQEALIKAKQEEDAKKAAEPQK